jgi:hypothetical protein
MISEFHPPVFLEKPGDSFSQITRGEYESNLNGE